MSNSLLPQRERVRARPAEFVMVELAREPLELLHAKWALDLLCLMASGIRRHARVFDNFPGISKKMLAEALRGLQHDGLVTRHIYPEALHGFALFPAAAAHICNRAQHDFLRTKIGTLRGAT